MFRSKIIPTTIVAVVALSVSGCSYQPLSIFASSDENEDGQEIAAVLGAKISLTDAIAAAEQTTGGRATKVDVEKEKGAYAFEVETVLKDKVTRIFVDPASGQVVRTDGEGLFSTLFDGEDRSEFAKLAASSTTLAAAIATAEQRIGGTAIEASVENADGGGGAILYEIGVVNEGSVQKVLIDAASGQVVKVSAAETGENGENEEH